MFKGQILNWEWKTPTCTMERAETLFKKIIVNLTILADS